MAETGQPDALRESIERSPYEFEHLTPRVYLLAHAPQ